MRAIIVAVLCLALTALFVPVAFAGTEVEIGGSLEVSGVYNKNHDFTYHVIDNQRFWEETALLWMTAKTAGDVKVYMSVTLYDDPWGTITSRAVDVSNTDVAYMEVPLGKVTVEAGRQLNNWGNGFVFFGQGVDRFKVSGKVNEEIEVGFFTDKEIEMNLPTFRGDTDFYAIPVVYKSGDLKAGFLLGHVRQNGYDTGVADGAVPGKRGTVYDVFVDTKMDKFSVQAEAALAGGDYFEIIDMDGNGVEDQNNKPMGAFVSASYDMSPMTVSLAGAYARNGFTADDEWAPTVMIGSDNSWAVTDFGAGMQDFAYAVIAGLDYKVNDDLTAGVKAMYAMLSSRHDASAYELDATAAYQITENASWSFGLGYMKPISMLVDPNVIDSGVKKDRALSAYHTISVEF